MCATRSSFSKCPHWNDCKGASPVAACCRQRSARNQSPLCSVTQHDGDRIFDIADDVFKPPLFGFGAFELAGGFGDSLDHAVDNGALDRVVHVLGKSPSEF